MADLQEYVDSQVAEIIPLKKISLALAERASAVKVSDAETLKTAVTVRKEITKHETAVKNARLDITRQFDDVKSQFITAEKDILAPAIEAKESVGHAIIVYQEEQEQLRLQEERRIADITAQFATNVRQIRTLKACDERGAELKAMFSKLPQTDQDNGIVKLAFTQAINSLLERKDEIRTAEVNELEQQKAVIDRRGDEALAQLQAAEAEKAAEAERKEAPKTGIKTVTRFTITSPELVPRKLCVPSEQLIREAIKLGVNSIPGVEITQEKSF